MIRRLAVALASVMFAASCGTATDGAPDAGNTQAAAVTTTSETASTTVAEAPRTSADSEEPHDETAHDDDDGAADEHDDEAAHEEGAEEGHSDESTETSGDGPRVIEVVMTEMAFAPDAVQVSAGETIVFRVTNAGTIEHEFRLSNPHRIEEHLASHDHGGHDEGGGHHEDADIVLVLDAEESGEVTVTFPEDTTVYTDVACLLPGHYEAGMKGIIEYAL